jgi:hypothetical protein
MTGQTLTVEQFTQSVAENIAKQFDLQPSELIKSLVDRLSTKLVDTLVKKQTTSPIQQKPTESKTSVVSDSTTKNVPTILDKGFETLLKFLQTPKASAAEPKKSLLEGKDEPKPFLFAGFTEQGLKQIQDKLPDILKKVLDKPSSAAKDKKGISEGGFGDLLSPSILKGALSVLTGIGGILLLLDGLRTSEWYKGLEKIAGKGLLQVSGFGKLIEGFAKKIVSNLIKIPARLIGSFSKSIMGLFGKEAGETALKTGLGAAKGIVPKILGGLLKFIKRVPLVGSLISVGFAVDRFKKGDIVGGGLEVLSALTGLLYLTPVTAPFAFPLSLAIDALNAFLDFKAGGIGENAKRSKSDIIGDWLKQAGTWIVEKMTAGFGWVVKIGEKAMQGNWGEAFIEVAKIVPGMGWLVDLMGGDEKVTEVGNQLGSQTVNFLDGVKTWVFEKIQMGLGWVGKIGKNIVDGKWGDVFVELSKFVPGMSWVVNLIGDEKVAEIGNEAGAASIDIFKSIKNIIMDKLKPIFGVWIKIGEKFMNSDPGGAIMDIAKMIPGLGWITSLLGENDLSSSINKAAETAASGNVFESISELFVDISQTIKEKFLENALYLVPDTILGFPIRALLAQKLGLSVPTGTTTKAEGWVASQIAGVVGYDEKSLENINPNQTTQDTPEQTVEASPTSAEAPKPVGDAMIKPDGGLVISSPTEGSLFQLSKNDGIVAAPIAESPNTNQGSGGSFTKAETILERIAENTGHTNQGMYNLINGFNNLAKALEKAGVNLGQNIIVANSEKQSDSKFAGVAQHIAAMSSPARSYNADFAGMMKPVRI